MIYSNYRILLAEDCPVQRARTEIMLRNIGFVIRSVDNGKKALELILDPANRQPDIVLTDIHMPVMDGLELCREIKNYNKDIRIIVLTATADDNALVQAFANGAMDFIRKPADKLELEARIKNVLEIIRNERRLKEALKQLEEKALMLEKLSVEDGLTGLYNRRQFHVLLSDKMFDARRYQAPLSLFMFDVDEFKKINDNYGHVVGDEVLVAVAKALRDGLRDSDYACRFGGDEFILIMTKSDIDVAFGAAENIRAQISAIRLESAPELRIKISGGVIGYDGEQQLDKLVDEADQSLYAAKKNGRDRIEKGLAK